MEALRKIQPLVCGNPCWSGSVALEEVLSEARQRQRRDPHAMCTKTLKVTRQHATFFPPPQPHTHIRTRGCGGTQKDTRWRWMLSESHAVKKRSTFPKNVPDPSTATLICCAISVVRVVISCHQSQNKDIWHRNTLQGWLYKEANTTGRNRNKTSSIVSSTKCFGCSGQLWNRVAGDLI